MSTLTKERVQKTTVTVDLPDPKVETPRQEIYRLLDRLIHEHGKNHRALPHPTMVKEAGTQHGEHRRMGPATFNQAYRPECIVACLAVLVGATPYKVETGGNVSGMFVNRALPARWKSEGELLNTMMDLNDSRLTWGTIRTRVTQEYPVAA